MPPLLLLDVDGVLTDEDARPDPKTLGMLGLLLEKGASAGLVTGRSAAWLEDRILAPDGPLSRYLPRGGGLACAAEYGAVYGLEPGRWRSRRAYRLPDDSRDAVRRHLESQECSRFLWWDSTKRCMATIEALHGEAGDAEYRLRTRAALAGLHRVLIAQPELGGCAITLSTYALDVTVAGLSKRVGAAWALRRLTYAGDARPVWIVADSAADEQIVAVARDAGHDVTWFWTGAAPPPSDVALRPVVTPAPFASGALWVLSHLL